MGLFICSRSFKSIARHTVTWQRVPVTVGEFWPSHSCDSDRTRPWGLRAGGRRRAGPSDDRPFSQIDDDVRTRVQDTTAERKQAGGFSL